MNPIDPRAQSAQNPALAAAQVQFAQLSRDVDLFLFNRADISDITAVDISVVIEEAEELIRTLQAFKGHINPSISAQNDDVAALSTIEPNTSERRIDSPIYPAGHVTANVGKAALLGIFDIAALAATPQPDAAGKWHIQTDDAGRYLALNHIDQAAESIGEWINAISLLQAHCGADIPDGGRDAAAWAIAGMSELLGELHRIRGALCLPTLSTVAVQQAIDAAQQNREAAP
jgi:hypothetical protein